jgi:formylglycine-generating enzyme required for sulfatase activity/tRNA A-37 threonylcarbamoyl transferase component Bud32
MTGGTGSVDTSGDLGQRLQAALGDAYRVDRPLGSGGFAVVFLVHDLQLRRKLAVKVLSPDLITSKTVLERFRQEATSVAGLSHPNIVPLHFIGEKEDLLYLAMACVEGGSLTDRLEREGRLPVEDASRIISEVASALAHAHKRGIVHRDIKPQNVLLDAESGRALLTDFGIARTQDSTTRTATGIVMGTAAYLAPEQVTGEPVDHRVDLYALGVMSYEMLTGRPPFETTLKRLAGPPTPIVQLRPDVPERLQKVLDACLATDPTQRFGDAADIVRMLTGQTPSSGEQGKSALPVRRRGVRRGWLAAAAVVTTGLAGAAWVALSGGFGTPALPAVPSVDSGMVLFPAGDYLVGSDSAPAESWFPAHRVSLAAFGLDRHEVSVGAYRAWLDSMRAPLPWDADSVPDAAVAATRVTYRQAEAYCRWRHPDGGRLPTEDEWEAAARGAAGRRYPWGDGSPSGRANLASSGRGGPSVPGAFVAGTTPEGIHDLIGNVWEWTSTAMRAYPGGPPVPDSITTWRVIRGGAFNTFDTTATSWRRQPFPEEARPEELTRTGFRCAMDARSGPGDDGRG